MTLGHGSKREKETDDSHYQGIGRMLGTTSISERGQVVIPDRARRELGIEGDDMFVVFGNKRTGSLILVKSEVFEKLADTFMSKLSRLESHANYFSRLTDEPDDDDDNEAGNGNGSVDGDGPAPPVSPAPSETTLPLTPSPVIARERSDRGNP
jgi:bifunctional DNA-binding transcriptional regulator/antitoxin component of YhaV-PrlF toxin-antitoxin module